MVPLKDVVSFLDRNHPQWRRDTIVQNKAYEKMKDWYVEMHRDIPELGEEIAKAVEEFMDGRRLEFYTRFCYFVMTNRNQNDPIRALLNMKEVIDALYKEENPQK